MILTYFSIISEAPLAFVVLMAAFVSALMSGLIFHEFCHAYVADRLGDRTARYMGRLTLNPKAHYDPIGTTLIFIMGFGWAKPVPVNPMNTANPKTAMAQIALAGPASNLVFATLAAIPIRLELVPFWHPFISPSQASGWAQVWTQSTTDLLGLFLGTVLVLNVLLAVFNMFPIPPLDGSRVLTGILPGPLAYQYSRLEPWGMGILLLVIMSGFLTNGEISIFRIMGPVVNFILGLLAGDAVGGFF